MEVFKYMACFLLILLSLYVLLRVCSKGIMRSYFELKEETRKKKREDGNV